MRVPISAIATLVILGNSYSASAMSCRQYLYSVASKEARKYSPVGKLRITNAFKFPSGPYRVEFDDFYGDQEIQVDITVDEACRVLYVNSGTDLSTRSMGGGEKPRFRSKDGRELSLKIYDEFQDPKLFEDAVFTEGGRSVMRSRCPRLEC